MARQSILDFLWHNAEQRGHETAALIKRADSFVSVNWADFVARAQIVSQALIRAGVQEGDRVALIMQTRLEWAVVDMGIAGAGAISVPIYASNLADECRFIVEDSGTKVVFCEDSTQSEKFCDAGGFVGALTHVVQMDGEPAAVMGASASGDKPAAQVHRYSDFIADVVADMTELRRRKSAIRRDTPFSVIYTSGTTGRPKGVISTHDNMLYEAEAIAQVDVLRTTDVELLILPLAHVFARALEIAWIGIGHVMAFAESMKTVREDMALSRPTVMAGVPRVFEKFYAAVRQKGHEKGGVLARLLDRAATVSARHGEAVMAGRRLPLAAQLEWQLYKSTIMRQVGAGLQKTMGGRMRMLVSGGAPLAPPIAWFFQDAGIEILEGFGLTETMAATCLNRPGKNRIGTVGLPFPGTDVKLAEDGELLMRGRSITPGYWQNPQATADAFLDGWFKTGDIAQLDDDGSIRIVDRKKDILVTAGGKNVAPQNVENMVRNHPLISQVVVHGDRRPFLTALITLDAEALARFAKEHQLGNESYAELCARPEVLREIEAGLKACNEQLPRYETIKKFKILPVDFSIESGELTPSLKLKRKVINQRYRDLFDGFYAA